MILGIQEKLRKQKDDSTADLEIPKETTVWPRPIYVYT